MSNDFIDVEVFGDFIEERALGSCLYLRFYCVFYCRFYFEVYFFKGFKFYLL